jgi:hypothetical protein
METYNKNPEEVSLLTPEQYRVTQQDGEYLRLFTQEA